MEYCITITLEGEHIPSICGEELEDSLMMHLLSNLKLYISNIVIDSSITGNTVTSTSFIEYMKTIGNTYNSNLFFKYMEDIALRAQKKEKTK